MPAENEMKTGTRQLSRTRQKARDRGGIMPWKTILASTAMLASAPAWATGAGGLTEIAMLSGANLPADAYLLSSAQLRLIRGRYVASNGAIIYFGVTLSSDWAHGGSSVQANLTMGFSRDPQGNFTPTTITHSVVGVLSSGDSGSSNQVEGDPPVNHMEGGLGQSIQVAGQGNVAHNTLGFDQSDGNASPNTNGNNTNNGSTLGIPSAGQTGATTTWNDPCGAANCMATVTRDGRGLTLSIKTDRGSVTQHVGSGTVLQTVQLQSNYNTIMNSLKLDLVRSTDSPGPKTIDTNALNRVLRLATPQWH